MTNNKQQTAVEFYLDKVFDIIGDAILDKLSIEQINKIHDLSLQAKAMEKEETTKFTIGYFNWLHNNGYKYNPKVKMYWKMMINETLFFTIEELMIEFNKIQ